MNDNNATAPIYLTAHESRVLGILATNKGIGPRELAKQLWPDPNDAIHTRAVRGGNGVARGKAAWLSAGSIIGRLCKMGLALRSYNPTSYYLTAEGAQLLKQENERTPYQDASIVRMRATILTCWDKEEVRTLPLYKTAAAYNLPDRYEYYGIKLVKLEPYKPS